MTRRRRPRPTLGLGWNDPRELDREIADVVRRARKALEALGGARSVVEAELEGMEQKLRGLAASASAAADALVAVRAYLPVTRRRR